MDAPARVSVLLSRPGPEPAGVLSLTLKKWTRLAADLSPDGSMPPSRNWTRPGSSCWTTRRRRFWFGCSSVVPRSSSTSAWWPMRLREVSEVESDRLRSALGQELVRLPKLAIPANNERMADEARRAQQRLDELASMLCDSPPDPPGQSEVHGMGHGMADGIAHPTIAVAGAVASAIAGTARGSKSSASESESLESNAHARPNLALIAHCFEHPGNLRRNCSGCAADRKAVS